MASLRRNRTMPTDGAIAKFLYTILKQLDLKSIDWQEVANGLDITNGHAARMRFSRFKQQMEGTQSQTRKPRATGPRPKKTKPDKPPTIENASKQQQKPMKGEPIIKDENSIKEEGGEDLIKREPIIKAEPGLEDVFMQDFEHMANTESIAKQEPKQEVEELWPSDGKLHAMPPVASSQDEQNLQVSNSPKDGDHKVSPERLVANEEPGKSEPAKDGPVVKAESSWEH